MFEWLSVTASSYMDYYVNFLAQQWNRLTPMTYGGVLISIGVFGWLLMKSGSKR